MRRRGPHPVDVVVVVFGALLAGGLGLAIGGVLGFAAGGPNLLTVAGAIATVVALVVGMRLVVGRIVAAAAGIGILLAGVRVNGVEPGGIVQAFPETEPARAWLWFGVIVVVTLIACLWPNRRAVATPGGEEPQALAETR